MVSKPALVYIVFLARPVSELFMPNQAIHSTVYMPAIRANLQEAIELWLEAGDPKATQGSREPDCRGCCLKIGLLRPLMKIAELSEDKV